MFTRYFLILLASLVTTTAHARNFFQIEEELDLTYTSIDTGTISLMNRIPIEIRVSDDMVFCRVKMSGLEEKCLISERNNGGSGPTGFAIYLESASWLKIFQAFATQNLIDAKYSAKLVRIHRNLEGKIPFWLREPRYKHHYPSTYTKQFDDNAEPEAFHFTFYEAKEPEQI